MMKMPQKVKQIDYALVAKMHTPMYMMHKYWARKPHNVVADYIKNYSKPEEIVLDPFVGSGVTAIEAIKSGRKGIGIDLNPISAFMIRCTAMPVDLNKFEEAFREIEKNVKDKINELYETKCIKCGNARTATHFVWKDKEAKEELTEIWYRCTCHGNTLKKKPDKEDLKNLEKTEKMKMPYWYPTTRLMYNGLDFKEGTHDPRINSVDKLFTKRNLISLSIIYNEIEKIKDAKVQELMKFVFTSMLAQASKMIPYSSGLTTGGPSWKMHRYWIPPEHFEMNVWHFFTNRFKKIYNGKQESNQLIQNYKGAKRFSELNDDANILIETHNALELKDIIPPNSIDYVFTDPPYGGAIQYFELSTLWASWLKMDLKYNDEITINRNQSKDFEYYHQMLRAAFKQVYQALKPGKYMTVTFHSADIKVWNSIIKAVVMVGFELEKIIYQPPAMPSAKGQLQPYGSAVGDYYIRFRKPEKEILETEKEIDNNTYEMEVVDAARGIIYERLEPTIYQHILNGIMAELQGGRRVPRGAKNIDEVLKEHIGNEFELIPIKDEKGNTIGKKWWLKGMDISHFSEPTLSDRVENSVVRVLESNIKVSFDDILQEIFKEYPNALTPETEKIKDVLKEYATMSEGKWQLKPELKMNLTESAHNKMIYFLASLGEKAGFDVWIGKNEQSDSYNKVKLESLVSIKKPIWRFVPSTNWDRINQIDVVWHDRGRINFEFEVENTTTITGAISRGSNIPPNHLTRVIVIPKEREKLLYRKMKDPMIGENVIKHNWKFIFYQDLEEFFNKNKGKKKIDFNELENLIREPEFKIEKQENLNSFNKNNNYS